MDSLCQMNSVGDFMLLLLLLLREDCKLLPHFLLHMAFTVMEYLSWYFSFYRVAWQMFNA